MKKMKKPRSLGHRRLWAQGGMLAHIELAQTRVQWSVYPIIQPGGTPQLISMFADLETAAV